MRHLLAQRNFAALVCAAALLLKLLVPTGYMITETHGTITISICSGMTPGTMTMAMPGMADDMKSMPDHGSSKDHGKTEMPCAYSGLSAQMLGAVDPFVLVAALAIVAALALLAVSPSMPRPPAYLRPRLRGPPLSPN